MPRPALLEFAPAEAPPTVEWLFLDLNSYFASVEQELRPELRNLPMGVVPLDTPNTVCIAASYEAKALGIKTGTKVKDARRICPGIALVESRPKIYVEYHHAILAAVEQCVPVSVVMSIDEAACRLAGLERFLPNARAIAAAIKQSIRGVGSTLRCSIGLAPSRYLAKVASDMQKPDGLTVLLKSELPQALLGLKLSDLPGIGRNTEARLAAQGVTTMDRLCAMSPTELHALWGGVVGECLWYWLRGEDFDQPDSGRKSLGRQHVLAPEFRSRTAAFGVAKKLLHSAAAELRTLDLWAGGLSIAVNFLDDRRARPQGPWVSKPSWKASLRMDRCRDVFTLQAYLDRLWCDCPDRKPILVYVSLYDLVAGGNQTLSLFEAEGAKRDRATAVMDSLNRRFGSQTVYPGGLHDSRRAAPTRIPFHSIPNLDRFD